MSSPAHAYPLEGGRSATSPMHAPGMAAAGFWRRALAYVLDVVLVAVGAIVLRLMLSFWLGAWLSGMIVISLEAAYFALFWSKKGQTPGYMALGIWLVRQDGRPVDVGIAAARFIVINIAAFLVGLEIGSLTLLVVAAVHPGVHLFVGRVVLLAALGLTGVANILAMCWDPERRMLHDRLVGTRVVRDDGPEFDDDSDESPNRYDENLGIYKDETTGHWVRRVES